MCHLCLCYLILYFYPDHPLIVFVHFFFLFGVFPLCVSSFLTLFNIETGTQITTQASCDIDMQHAPEELSPAARKLQRPDVHLLSRMLIFPTRKAKVPEKPKSGACSHGTFNENKELYFEQDKITASRLSRKLKRSSKNGSIGQVLIDAEKTSTYSDVMEIIDIVKEAGVNSIGLAVNKRNINEK